MRTFKNSTQSNYTGIELFCYTCSWKCYVYIPILCLHSLCSENLQELTRARTELEQQLEEASSQKKEAERRLTQSMARLDALLEEKNKMEASNSTLEETIRSLR